MVNRKAVEQALEESAAIRKKLEQVGRLHLDGRLNELPPIVVQGVEVPHWALEVNAHAVLHGAALDGQERGMANVILALLREREEYLAPADEAKP